jgi:hypothetical protein
MIQIQRREQFTKAAERLRQEPQSIRRHEPGLWIVTNKVKGHAYAVRLIHQDGKTFMRCGCEAGSPTKGRRIPVVCKHMCTLVIFLRAVREMRRAASH